MDTKALRQKILDLAIRGKLVPQDPNDEPASALLERIRAQKQQMVKDGKLKAKDIKDDTIIFVGEDNLHYEKFADGSIKCIEDQIIVSVPSSWAWVKMSTIAFVTKLAGFEYTKNVAPNLVSEGVPLFKGKNIQNGEIIYEFESFIPLEVSNELSRSQITKKCLLTPYVGTIGNIGIHDKNGVYHLGSNVGKIELYNDTETLLEEYVLAYLRSQFGNKQLTKHMKATAQASISIEAIRDVYIPIPPAKEQKRICTEIEIALGFINNVETEKENISHLIDITKSKILDLAIRGKLVPQDPSDEPASVLLERIRAEKEALIKAGKIKRDKKESIIFKGEDNSYYEKIGSEIKNIDDEIPFDIPNTWCWCRMENLMLLINGVTYDKNDVQIEGIRIIRGGNLSANNEICFFDNDIFLPAKYKNSENQIYYGDIVIVASTGSTAVIGKPSFAISNFEDVQIGGFLKIIRPLNNECRQLLWLLFLSDYYHNHIVSSVGGVNINNIKADHLKKMLIPMPPIEELSRIFTAYNKHKALLIQLEDNIS